MPSVYRLNSLTLQDRTFLDRLARGWDFPEIAHHLNITQNTLAVMLSTIIAKMKVRTIYQALAYAVYARVIYPFDTPAITPAGRRREEAGKLGDVTVEGERG